MKKISLWRGVNLPDAFSLNGHFSRRGSFHNFVPLIKQICKVSRPVANEPRENKAGIKREWPREEGLVRVVTRVCTCYSRVPCVRKASYAPWAKPVEYLNEGDARIYIRTCASRRGMVVVMMVWCGYHAYRGNRYVPMWAHGAPMDNQPRPILSLPENFALTLQEFL